jgi:manganese efflux pump family protein
MQPGYWPGCGAIRRYPNRQTICRELVVVMFLTVFLTGVGLSMDAFAVSVSSGITIRRPTIANAALIAGFFGGFQALMPLVGWIGGRYLAELLQAVDHWVAFGILAVIGAKMIYESYRGAENEVINPLNLGVLASLAVATSIDALAVGVSFAFLSIPIVPAAALIGAVTFGICFAGVFAGDRFGHLLGGKAGLVGGLALIAIGLKILLEDLLLIA